MTAHDARPRADAAVWAGRRPGPGLVELLAQLWPDRDLTGVRLTAGEPPEGYRVVERYAVMPSVERARMLVPENRRCAVRALTAYASLRDPRTRALKQASALAMRAGLGRLIMRDHLAVCVPQRTADADLPDLLLLAHLDATLRRGSHLALAGVGVPAPNRKPTLQLFDPAGAPGAYVKVGWNEYTRGLVRREAQVLAASPPDAPGRLPRRPAVLHHGQWRGLELLATAPLPPRIRRQPPAAWPDPRVEAAVLAEHPASGAADGAGDGAVPLAGSAYAVRLRAELDDAVRHGSLNPQEAGDLGTYLRALLAAHGEAMITPAPWHGDFSPWNIGIDGDETWVWDWEHHGEGIPAGMDLVHYAFQRAFVPGGRTVVRALAEAEEGLPAALAALGRPPGDTRLLVSLYLCEVFFRACRMHRSGAGWNPRFRAGALEAIRSRVP